MRHIILGTIAIVAAGTMIAGGTMAFFNDPETAGNTFATGVIDLKIDNESYYNGELNEETTWIEPVDLDEGHFFFNFLDLKPDDEGEDTISLHIGTNDAWACLALEMTKNDDVSSNEPELETGDDPEDELNDWDGELAQAINFVWWADDGDNVLEVGENIFSDGIQTLWDLATSTGPFIVSLADSETNVWTGQGGDAIPAGETRYVGKAWCFGDMNLAPLPQDGLGHEGDNGPLDRGTGVGCNGTNLGNETQTDQVMVNVHFLASQARHNSEFVCGDPIDEIIACEPEASFADEVVFVDQGLRKNSTAVAADRSNTSFALGAPQSLGTPYDNPVTPSSFFSLGFPLGGHTAEIVLSFNDNYVVNAAGTDLKLWEVTGGTSYPDERVDVYLGNTPVGPWTLVASAVTRDAEIDLEGSGVDAARYVRIVDASDIGLFEATADGFDLDAVEAQNCVVSPIQ